MYRPRAFAVDDASWCRDLARRHGFATVVAGADEDVDGPARIGHVPTVVAGDVVAFHVAAVQPLARLADGDQVVVVFHGPHARVSASWYAEPTRAVPTWDHEAVHATGVVRRLHREGLLAHLRDLVEREEGPAGWDPDAAADEVARILDGARGFTVEVRRWEGVAKLSQNRSDEDRRRIGIALLRSPDATTRRTGERVLSALAADGPAPHGDAAPPTSPPAAPGPALTELELRLPVAGDRAAFLAASRASRGLHAGWADPPTDEAGFEEWLAKVDPVTNRRHLVLHRGELVGLVNLQNVVYGQGQYATLGYLAFAAGARRGLMRRAVALGVDVALRDMGLHRVEAGIQPTNTPSIRLVRALGFRFEGLLTRLVRVDDEWRDHELWATDAEDWPGAAAIFG